MNINELQRFQGVGHNILLTCFGHSFSDITWACEIEAEHEGTKLKVKGEGPTPEGAASIAFAKFDRATTSGLPELNPQLTYEGQVVDDEVPY